MFWNFFQNIQVVLRRGSCATNIRRNDSLTGFGRRAGSRTPSSPQSQAVSKTTLWTTLVPTPSVLAILRMSAHACAECGAKLLSADLQKWSPSRGEPIDPSPTFGARHLRQGGSFLGHEKFRRQELALGRVRRSAGCTDRAGPCLLSLSGSSSQPVFATATTT
jgi:hypothetical protein